MKLGRTIGLLGVVALINLAACEKYVDIEPKGQLIPSTVEDFRMLLDEVQKMNFTGIVGALGTDNVYFDEMEFQGLGNVFEKNSYVWNKEVYREFDAAPDWNIPYERIYNANIVLEGLDKTDSGTEIERRTVRGDALFHRAAALYEVVALYAKSYDPATAQTDLGVPIRLTSNVMELSTRPTLQETYDQIFSDLAEAETLLPEKAEIQTRGSKWAVYALLARIYTDMEQYDKSLENALKALEIQADLMDYNTRDPFAWPIFEELNKETIFFQTIPFFGYSFFQFPVPEALYNLYEADDLRKSLYFQVNSNPGSGTQSIAVGGHYGAGWNQFTGLATDELYLIAAEGYTRTGHFEQALDYLNDLLEMRYVTGTYVPFESTDETEILNKIILERRKELVGRNRRWFDLKRFNKDPRFDVTLERTVSGQTYTLPPNDPRYVFPIPQTVISVSGIEQNER